MLAFALQFINSLVEIHTCAQSPKTAKQAQERQPTSGSLGDMADVEDPKHELEETCKPGCIKQLVAYQECAKRITSDTTGEAHCTGQYFDYWGCIDKCVATRLFNVLK
jgi:ubiquinol-cytochrome c reductase subunit 6